MKKTKMEKGITLIALIITIVVLLILAVVAINSIQDDGILGHAQNAAETYNQAVKNEQGMLQNYIDYLEKYNDKYNGGSTPKITWTCEGELAVGSTVKTSTNEEFYVFKIEGETVKLLAKQCIDTENLVQSASANYIAFSETNYWVDTATSYPYDLTENGVPDESHIAARAAYDYGEKLGGAGRLMTYNEALALATEFTDSGDQMENVIFRGGCKSYWLGTALTSGSVRFVGTGDGGYPGYDSFSYGSDRAGVRPVIEISKSKIF